MKTETWNVKSYGILQHTFVAIGVLGLIYNLSCTCKGQSLTERKVNT